MSANTVNRDSRSTAYCGALRRAGAPRAEPVVSTRGMVSEPLAFRRLVRALLDARPTARATPFDRAVAFLRAAREPGACINVLLDECATNSGQDGLGLGIDVLERVGSPVLEVADQFVTSDERVREAAVKQTVFSRQDDVWYVLLRGSARTKTPPLGRYSLLVRTFMRHPSLVVQTAALEGLGDLGAAEPAVRPAVRVFLQIVAKGILKPELAGYARVVLADLED